jgi:hypothetical protein
VDGTELGAVPGGQGLAIPQLTNGDHMVKFAARNATTEIVFKATDGAMPEFSYPSTGSLTVMIFATAGDKGRFWSSRAPVRLSWDKGATFQTVNAEGAPLESLKPGLSEVMIESGGVRRTETLALEQAPGLTILVYSSEKPPEPRGQILITSNDSEFELLLDNRRVTYTARGGDYVVANVNAGKRRIQFRKPGFEIEPESATIDVRANQAARVTVNFKTQPTRLSIRGGTPGAQIFEGNRSVGALDGQGAFSTVALTPGDHVIELRKKGYRNKQLRVTIEAGREMVLNSEATLIMATATVTFVKVEPKTRVSLTLQQAQGDLPYQGPVRYAEVPAQVVVPQGVYNMSLSAPGYEQLDINAVLKDPQDRLNIEIRLSKK